MCGYCTITALTGQEQPTMATTDTADQFGRLLRTVDPASLSAEDKLVLISLLQRCLDGDGSRDDDEAAQ